MSLVTPDLKQEQDGLSSLVDARAGGRGAVLPQVKQPRKQDNYQVRKEFLKKEPAYTRVIQQCPGPVFTGDCVHGLLPSEKQGIVCVS